MIQYCVNSIRDYSDPIHVYRSLVFIGVRGRLGGARGLWAMTLVTMKFYVNHVWYRCCGSSFANYWEAFRVLVSRFSKVTTVFAPVLFLGWLSLRPLI